MRRVSILVEAVDLPSRSRSGASQFERRARSRHGFALLPSFIIGRWWIIPAAAVIWVVLLLATDTIGAAEIPGRLA
jgi:hypothetical protein